MNDEYQWTVDVNHSNVIQSKVNGVYMITSSPNFLNWEEIKNYPYLVFIIHPNLLEDYALDNKINLAFTNATVKEISDINERIYEDIGIYKAFRWLSGNYKENKEE